MSGQNYSGRLTAIPTITFEDAKDHWTTQLGYADDLELVAEWSLLQSQPKFDIEGRKTPGGIKWTGDECLMNCLEGAGGYLNTTSALTSDGGGEKALIYILHKLLISKPDKLHKADDNRTSSAALVEWVIRKAVPGVTRSGLAEDTAVMVTEIMSPIWQNVGGTFSQQARGAGEYTGKAAKKPQLANKKKTEQFYKGKASPDTHVQYEASEYYGGALSNESEDMKSDFQAAIVKIFEGGEDKIAAMPEDTPKEIEAKNKAYEDFGKIEGDGLMHSVQSGHTGKKYQPSWVDKAFTDVICLVYLGLVGATARDSMPTGVVKQNTVKNQKNQYFQFAPTDPNDEDSSHIFTFSTDEMYYKRVSELTKADFVQGLKWGAALRYWQSLEAQYNAMEVHGGADVTMQHDHITNTTTTTQTGTVKGFDEASKVIIDSHLKTMEETLNWTQEMRDAFDWAVMQNRKTPVVHHHPNYLAESLMIGVLPEYPQQDDFATSQWADAEKAKTAALKKMLQGINDVSAKMSPRSKSTAHKIKQKKEELRKNIKQCVLLAGMSELENLSIMLRTYQDKSGGAIRGEIAAGTTIKIPADDAHLPYGGRVIPLSIKPYQNFINALTLPPMTSEGDATVSINDYLNCSEYFTRGVRTFVRLSKIVKNYTDKNGKLINNGEEVELPMLFPFSRLIEDGSGTNVAKEIFIEKAFRKDIKDLYRGDIITMNSIDINFKGGNTATAKSDVTVKIDFHLPDIRLLEQVFEYEYEIEGWDGKMQDVKYEFSFLDLITYTNNSNPTGFSSAFRNQYHPDYNRLLLKSYVYHDPGEDDSYSPAHYKAMNKMLSNVPLALDIAVVDHEIKKDEKTNKTTVTVEYRGYVDSVLTDPSMDALAGQKTVKDRIGREMNLRGAMMQGCNPKKIQDKIRSLRNNAHTDTFETLPRIISALNDSDRLFTVGIQNKVVTSALSTLGTSIIKPKEITEHLQKTHNFANLAKQIFLYRQLTKEKGWIKGVLPHGTKILEKYKSLNADTGIASDFNAKWRQEFTTSGQDSSYKGKTKPPPIKKQDFSDIQFFFFGDLVDVLLDGMHENMWLTQGGKKTDVDRRSLRQTLEADKTFSFPHPVRDRKLSKSLGGYYYSPPRTKVILPSFRWYLPNNDGVYEEMDSNLADVPIHLEWFADWFRKEIINKKLSYYPVATFLKSLAQNIITRLMGEVCFDIASENKVLFRASMDIGLVGTKRKEAIRGKLMCFENILDSYSAARISKRLVNGVLEYKYSDTKSVKKFPLLKKNSMRYRDEYYNYLILYPANARSFEFQSAQGDSSAHQNGIPEFKYRTIVDEILVNGDDELGVGSLISKMSFSKKDAPYRREVKFFASNQGNLAQIAGVYNVKIEMGGACFFLYPGQLCWVDGGLGDAPNKLNSMAFHLGIGGYYQIISVNHKMKFSGGKSPLCTTTVEAAWVNYGLKSEDKANNAGVDRFRLPKKKTKVNQKVANCNSNFSGPWKGQAAALKALQGAGSHNTKKNPKIGGGGGSSGGSSGGSVPKKTVPPALTSSTVGLRAGDTINFEGKIAKEGELDTITLSKDFEMRGKDEYSKYEYGSISTFPDLKGYRTLGIQIEGGSGNDFVHWRSNVKPTENDWMGWDRNATDHNGNTVYVLISNGLWVMAVYNPKDKRVEFYTTDMKINDEEDYEKGVQ